MLHVDGLVYFVFFNGSIFRALYCIGTFIVVNFDDMYIYIYILFYWSFYYDAKQIIMLYDKELLKLVNGIELKWN